jgi:hypothetical protein
MAAGIPETASANSPITAIAEEFKKLNLQMAKDNLEAAKIKEPSKGAKSQAQQGA